MFRQDWEWQLAEKTDVRDWDHHLNPLFDNGTSDNGIVVFFGQVGEIQSDLSDACRSFFENLKEISTSA